MVCASYTHSHTRAFRQSLSFTSVWRDISTTLDHIHHTVVWCTGPCSVFERETGPSYHISPDSTSPSTSLLCPFTHLFSYLFLFSLSFSILTPFLSPFLLPVSFSTCRMWFSSTCCLPFTPMTLLLFASFYSLLHFSFLSLHYNSHLQSLVLNLLYRDSFGTSVLSDLSIGPQSFVLLLYLWSFLNFFFFLISHLKSVTFQLSFLPMFLLLHRCPPKCALFLLCLLFYFFCCSSDVWMLSSSSSNNTSY